MNKTNDINKSSSKTCIICNNIANSKEHIFPAAFGGRVVNKSIYCSAHNGAYSRHVDSLDKELDILNSAIGVIPDRKNSIKETRLKDSASEEYVYTKDYMKLASPSALDMAPNSGAEQMQLWFADHMQAQKWMDEQKKRGYEFKNTSYGKVTKTMFVEPMKKTMDLGNDKFMLGVLYIALTFLVHHYPHIARAKELQSVKDILNNHVKVGNFKFESKKNDSDKRHETDEVSAWNVIRIPILQNDFGNSENNDPEMTVSNTNAEHILNILGIQDDELVGTIPHNQVNKLLMKLRNISNKTVDVNIREPEIGDNFHNFGLDRNRIETYISVLIKICLFTLLIRPNSTN